VIFGLRIAGVSIVEWRVNDSNESNDYGNELHGPPTFVGLLNDARRTSVRLHACSSEFNEVYCAKFRHHSKRTLPIKHFVVLQQLKSRAISDTSAPSHTHTRTHAHTHSVRNMRIFQQVDTQLSARCRQSITAVERCRESMQLVPSEAISIDCCSDFCLHVRARLDTAMK
jgi:hypothetical protein